MVYYYKIVFRRVARVLLLLSLLTCGNIAAATELEGARQLFNIGDYEAAQSMAVALETADGYILASEAVTAQILLGHFDKPNRPAKEARLLAEKALLIDPNNLDARLQQGVAFGLETQSTSIMTAWRKKLPVRMYDMIKLLHQDAPDDPRSHALLGAWHLGIVNEIGEKNAYKWYKANSEDGKIYYEMALQLTEGNTMDDIVITSNYAASTILLDDPDYGKQLLSSVLNMTPSNAAETGVQKRVSELAALSDNPKAFKKAAKDFLYNRPF